METLKCGCQVGYSFCSGAQKIYIHPFDKKITKQQRLTMWEKIHEHYDLNRIVLPQSNGQHCLGVQGTEKSNRLPFKHRPTDYPVECRLIVWGA